MGIMWDWLPAALKGLDTAERTARAFRGLQRGRRGARHALLDELRHNATVCWLFIERDVALDRVVAELRHEVYDRLAGEGFDFDVLRRARIAAHPSLERTGLHPFVGRRTGHLVHALYDRIKDLKLTHRLSADHPGNRFPMRVRNIQRRILLLLWHLQGAR
jgi:hypothetical protein